MATAVIVLESWHRSGCISVIWPFGIDDVVQGGLIEWLKVEDFQKCMDVNYFGDIRVTKVIRGFFSLSKCLPGGLTKVLILHFVAFFLMVNDRLFSHW